MRGRPRRRVLVTAAVASTVVAALIAWRGLQPTPPLPAPSGATQPTARDAAPPPADDETLGLPSANAVGVPTEQAGAGDPLAGEEPNAWAAVDLEAVRAAMPDNLYWRMSAPTKDPEVERQRLEERARWNEAYGKVLSNTASEEEILAYYAHRDRLASDYVQFATYVLENYGTQLSIRDLGLLKVAVELNLARLEEIPREIAEAQERRKAHEAAREQWRQDQADFAGAPPASR